jgi:hypothetical protein
MRLRQIQRDMFEVVRTPLTANETTRLNTVSGRDTRRIAEAIVLPNDRLSSLERLEIYNRQYWFRLISALTEDFEGLRTIIGAAKFDKLAVDYLTECPSQSFTLRNLGAKLPQWLALHPECAGHRHAAALDMAKLEWAEVEAFDGETVPGLTMEAVAALGPDPALRIQPYIQLLELRFPVDELLLSIRHKDEQNSISANSASTHLVRRRVANRAPLHRSRNPIYLAVHRHEYSVYFKRLDSREYQMLRALRPGTRLSKAIDTVHWGSTDPEEAITQVQEWFANWASLGWLAVSAKAASSK